MNDAIRQAISVLTAPGQVIELRAIGEHITSGYFDNPDELTRIATILDTSWYQGIYLTLNPVREALLSRRANRIKQRLGRTDPSTADVDIISRTWLPIDLDPIRPAGISSSDEEHQAAITRAGEVAAFLTDLGFPAPIIADSGNGAHLLYRIDLPNDKSSRDLIAACLTSLDIRFSDHWCRVDTANANASRIWKLYGTLSRKGDSTASRPHRRSALLQVPKEVSVVSPALLKRLASLYPTEPTLHHKPVFNRGGAPFDLKAWLDQHLPGYREKPYLGGTLYLLDSCPFSTAHQDGAYAIQFANGAIFAGCHHDSCGGGTQRWSDLKARFDPPSPPRKKHADSRQASALQAESGVPEKDPAPLPFQAEALQIMQNESPLQYLMSTFALDHEGDKTVAESLIMSLASRSVLNSKGLHVSITGESGKGKSHAIGTLLRQVPPAYRLDGRISEKALFYITDMQPGTVIALDDHALSDQMQEILKGVTSSFQREFVYRTVSKDRTGQVCTIPERCVWWIAKVEGTGDDQIFNRMLTCWIDDSEDQDLRVLKRTLEHAGQGPACTELDRDEIRVCQEIWQQLGMVYVIIPYADRIRFVSAENRRNPDMLLDLIRSSAALMQLQREEEEIHGIRCIRATEEDFYEACRLYSALNGESGSQGTKLTRRESDLVAVIHQANRPELTVNDLQQLTRWNHSTIHKLLNGYISKGQSYSGLLAKCPAVSFLDRTISSGDDGRSTQRRVRVYTWNPSLYASWIAGGEVWLSAADHSGSDDPGSPEDPPMGGSAAKDGSMRHDAATCRPKIPEEIPYNSKNKIMYRDSNSWAADPEEMKPGVGSAEIVDHGSSDLPICRTAAHDDHPGEYMAAIEDQTLKSGADSAAQPPLPGAVPAPPIRAGDFIAVQGWPQKKPCAVCGRQYTQYQERMTHERMAGPFRPNRMLCSVCYEAAQVREALAIRTIPGVIDLNALQKRSSPTGKCSVCHTGGSVWIDPGQQVGLCEPCYRRERSLRDGDAR